MKIAALIWIAVPTLILTAAPAAAQMHDQMPKTHSTTTAPTAQPVMAHPGAPNLHMRKALALLQQAEAELNLAKKNKDGHRGDAVREIDVAMKDINQGIAYSEGSAH